MEFVYFISSNSINATQREGAGKAIRTWVPVVSNPALTMTKLIIIIYFSSHLLLVKNAELGKVL